ncbi:MAG: 4-(cytidine 5'-diphospho)-2-C-methyl-D-erythritol kinase [Rubrivivax sp.]|nr:4-(cytidine 5'-diphospho)-2-C-methyl-D-erythritol kinase [Rubrivivax sp.]
MPLKALYDLPAPAKLNRFLHVIGRRADGYHLLQSVFVLIDWADRLHIERRSDGRLLRHDLGPTLPADDLCLRAARALQAASGTHWGADIHIDKQLPWGAGLGGGSSDAATVLLALNRLWGLDWPRGQLAKIGLQLGADVPFFIGGHNALVEGIGERLTPMRVVPCTYAVIKPPVNIATRDIFEHPKLVRDTAAVIVTGSFGGLVSESGDGKQGIGLLAQERSQDPAKWSADFGKNDLQLAAEERWPEVAQAVGWLGARFGNSRMTGSGSAVFATIGAPIGLFSGAAVGAEVIIKSGTAEPPLAAFPVDELPAGWVGRMCRGLEDHPLAGWASD